MQVARSPFSLVSCLLVGMVVAEPAGGTPPELQGLELDVAVQLLSSDGLPVVYTSELVRPGMIVVAEPESRDPREMLNEILDPFALRAQEGAGDLLVVVRLNPAGERGVITGRVRDRATLEPLAGSIVRLGDGREVSTSASGRFAIPEVAPGRHTLVASARGFLNETVAGVAVTEDAARHVELLLSPAPYLEQKIEVFRPSESMSGEALATTWSLGHDELGNLPHLGDPLRGLALAAGTASADLSSHISVRGGRTDETRIVLDGQEIYDAYHLKDYESALTIIPSLGLASANLLSGGLSAAYGDRLGGLVDLRTRGSADPTGRFSLSTLDALAQTSGATASGRVSWLVSARRGVIDIASEVSDDERPSFWDAFGRLEVRASEHHSLRAHALFAEDGVDYLARDGDEEDRLTTDYTSGAAWLVHGWATRSFFLETTLSKSRATRDRHGGEIEDEKVFAVDDERDLDVFGASQQAFVQAGSRNQVRLGWELRNFDASLHYRSDVEPDLVIEAPFSPPRSTTTEFDDEFHERHWAFWVSDQWSAGNVVAEVGARFDDHSLPEESFWSPRVAVAWQVASRSALLATWGIYRQSQRPYELQIEDGETLLALAERSEQWSAGYERTFERGPLPIDSLHIEYFRKDVDNPRARYENLLEPVNRFHEVEPDRVRIEPDGHRAEGIELLARGRRGDLGWQFGYTWSESADRFGTETVPSRFDQPHAATFTLDYAFREGWRADLAAIYHSGWPTTPITTPDEGGESPRLVFGPLNSERMPDYHRIDVRINRSWQLRMGTIHAFVEARNVLDRQNVAGYDVAIDSGELVVEAEHWPGIVPVVGFVWELCGSGCGLR